MPDNAVGFAIRGSLMMNTNARSPTGTPPAVSSSAFGLQPNHMLEWDNGSF
jgi:hypothetical protein